MKKRLFFIISLLTIIFLLSLSAVCTQCGKSGDADKTDVESTEDGKTAEDDGDDDGESEETKDTDGKDSEKDDNEDVEETESTESEETTEEEDEDDDEGEEKEAPTITLEIYEGPTYSASDNICYYRLKATVTGNPKPTVTFSKDDSHGAWGSLKCQVNLDEGDTYTLTAKAKNSEGEAVATKELTWGCSEGNEEPDVDAIIISDDTPETNQTYVLSADADDPDGDSLSYKWSVSGGTLSSDSGNPVNWTTPAAAGDYTIKVKVDDGRDGEDDKTRTITVTAPAPVSANMPVITAETGYINMDGSVINVPGCIYAGDTDANKNCKGFICFNISSLAGKTVLSSSIQFSIKQKWGDPGPVFSNLSVTTFDWGSGPPGLEDYGTGGVVIGSAFDTGSGSFTINTADLKTELQNAINDGKSKFKVRIHFVGPLTDGANDWDGWEYDPSGVILNVTY